MLQPVSIEGVTTLTFQPLSVGGDFIELAVFFIILAVIAAVLGAQGIAGLSWTIAKWLVIIFIVLAIVSFLL